MKQTPSRAVSRLDKDVVHAVSWGLFASGILLLAIYFGSGRFRYFDAALVPYTGAALFSCFGIAYRYAMWLRRPPTRKYWFAGWRIFIRPSQLPRNMLRLAQLFFGWVHFTSAPHDQHLYQAFVFGQHVFTFRLGTVTAFLTFNVLNISAVMVLTGVAIAMWRRARDRGAIAVQQFAQDMMPLLMLFAISITGLFLTASTHLLHGLNYGFLSLLHAVTVIFTLLYLPFGKFFHIFQRPAQLGVQFYKDEGQRGRQVACSGCGQPFASLMHVNDLKEVEGQLDIHYEMPEGGHYQDVCPTCRRKSVALAQDGAWRRQGTRLGPNLDAIRTIWPNHP